MPFIECDDGDQCGCTRSFAGLTSHRATTTAVVVDRPELDQATYTGLLLDDLTTTSPRHDWLDRPNSR